MRDGGVTLYSAPFHVVEFPERVRRVVGAGALHGDLCVRPVVERQAFGTRRGGVSTAGAMQLKEMP